MAQFILTIKNLLQAYIPSTILHDFKCPLNISHGTKTRMCVLLMQQYCNYLDTKNTDKYYDHHKFSSSKMVSYLITHFTKFILNLSQDSN